LWPLGLADFGAVADAPAAHRWLGRSQNMKRNFIFISVLIGIMVLFVAGLAPAKDKADPLTGTWSCQAKGGPEGDMPFTLYLQQAGTNVDGSVSSPLGDTSISSGTFKSDTLEIHIDSPDGEYVLIAKLDKGALSGTWTMSTDKGTWEGKKQAADSK